MNEPPTRAWLKRRGGIAERLATIREATGRSGRQLADEAGWSSSKVSRIETGLTAPSASDITTWARLCDAGQDVTDDLLRMLDELADMRRDWRRRMAGGNANVQADYAELEQSSQTICYCEFMVIPGLLQTGDYAASILAHILELNDIAAPDVDAAVATRLQRQQILYDRGRRFEFLIGEAALRWYLCTPEVMRGQLDRLQTAIGMPGVRLGVLPFGRLATFPQNSFQIFDDLVIVDTAGSEFRHSDERVAVYLRSLERFWAEAAEGDVARRLIVAAADALPR